MRLVPSFVMSVRMYPGFYTCQILMTNILDYHSNLCTKSKFLEGKVKVKVKVKVTLVQALRLCTDRTAHGGSRGIALLFHDQRY
jgi:hypothetical protein